MQQPESKQLPWHKRQWQIGTVVGLRPPGKATGFIEHGSSADGTALQSVVPAGNGPGFIHHRRHNVFDEEDMNRIWPGKERGSMSQQIASHLYQQVIRHAVK